MSPDVIGYLDRLTARPGEELTLYVSTLAGRSRYGAKLVRLLCGDTGPAGPGLKEEEIASPLDGEHEGKEQPLRAGSCMVVDRLPQMDGKVTLEIAVWPTLPGKGEQVLVALGGIRLVLDDWGRPALLAAESRLCLERRLSPRRWFHLRATYHPGSGSAVLELVSLDEAAGGVTARGDLARSVVPSGPLVFAAAPAGPAGYCGHFDGKLARPAVTSGKRVMRWDFAADMASSSVREVTGTGCHGRTRNSPKRAVTGPDWDGTVHMWEHKPGHYDAIHFHRDDLYDAGWQPSHRFRLPSDLKSGFYAVRLEGGGSPFHVGFIVSPPVGAARAKLAVLASTVTYLAYSNQRSRMKPGPFDLGLGTLPLIDTTDLLLATLPAAGSSTYDLHADGSGVGFASSRRPLFNFRPTGRLWNFAMDLSLIDWLETMAIPYDVVSDHDLHRYGMRLLEPYTCVVTGSHPEYFSLEMLQGLEGLLGGGGRLIYAGGNGFYWRVVFDPGHPDQIEVRRTEDGARSWEEMPGQYYHANGDYGGLWRRVGRPPNALVGVGFVAQGFDMAAAYRRSKGSYDPRAAFLFDGIDGETFGGFGAWGQGAAGAEIDAWQSGLGTPENALVLATSEPLSNAYLLTKEEMLSTAAVVNGAQNKAIRADMVFFETPAGGAVLSTGSVSFIASLGEHGCRNPISTLLGNAVRRFLDPELFVMRGFKDGLHRDKSTESGGFG